MPRCFRSHTLKAALWLGLVLVFLAAGSIGARPGAMVGEGLVVASNTADDGDGRDDGALESVAGPGRVLQMVGLVPLARPRVVAMRLTRAYVDFSQLKVAPGPDGGAVGSRVAWSEEAGA